MINYWTNTCKFKIDKKTYSKWQSRTYEVSKNKQLWRIYCILKNTNSHYLVLNATTQGVIQKKFLGSVVQRIDQAIIKSSWGSEYTYITELMLWPHLRKFVNVKWIKIPTVAALHIAIWEQWSNVHEPLKNRIYLGKKLFFNFLHTDFLLPKTSYWLEK